MFKDNLKKLRKDNKLTQGELADHFGYSHVAVVKWENGTREPDFKTLKELATFFNVSVDYLLGTSDSIYTAEDYANGVTDTKQVRITADDEDMLDKLHEVERLLGEKGKNLVIEFCDMLLEKFGR